jgi:DivIVA domain-containing protein
MWLWVLVLVVIIGAIAVVVAGRGDDMAEVYDDRPDVTLPTDRQLTADDVADVRFSTGVRGYRMDEVDAFVARVQQDLLERQQGSGSTGFETLDVPQDGIASHEQSVDTVEPAHADDLGAQDGAHDRRDVSPVHEVDRTESPPASPGASAGTASS